MPFLAFFSKKYKPSRDKGNKVPGHSDRESSTSPKSDHPDFLPPPRLVTASAQASSSKTRLPGPWTSLHFSSEVSTDNVFLLRDPSRPPQLQLNLPPSDDISTLEQSVLYPPSRRAPELRNESPTPPLATSQNIPTQPGERLSNPSGTLRTVVDLSDPPQFPPPKKSAPGGLFSWPKSNVKPSFLSEPKQSKAKSAASTQQSFNLKSFRHVSGYQFDGRVSPPPTAPLTSKSSPQISLSESESRPRGSLDPSQRISVAAFREVQARRDSLNPSTSSHGHTQSPQRHSRAQMLVQDSATFSTTSEEESDESNSEASVLDEPQLKRRNTITRKRPGRTAPQSEGHNTARKVYHGTRPRAASTDGRPGAVTYPPLPSGSAKVIVGSSSPLPVMQSKSEMSEDLYRRSLSARVMSGNSGARQSASSVDNTASTHTRQPAESETSDSDSSDSNTPLATLATKRPGIATSAATTRLRVPTRPLIDIKTLTADKPGQGIVDRNEGNGGDVDAAHQMRPTSVSSWVPVVEPEGVDHTTRDMPAGGAPSNRTLGSSHPSNTSPPRRPPRATPPLWGSSSPAGKGFPRTNDETLSNRRTSETLSSTPSSPASPSTPRAKTISAPDPPSPRAKGRPPAPRPGGATPVASPPRLSARSESEKSASPSSILRKDQAQSTRTTFDLRLARLAASAKASSLGGDQAFPKATPEHRSHRRSLSHGSGLDTITPGGLSAIPSPSQTPASGPSPAPSRATTPSSPEGWEVIKKESPEEEQNRIIPTPIRQRTPPPAFTVTSRPARRATQPLPSPSSSVGVFHPVTSPPPTSTSSRLAAPPPKSPSSWSMTPPTSSSAQIAPPSSSSSQPMAPPASASSSQLVAPPPSSSSSRPAASPTSSSFQFAEPFASWSSSRSATSPATSSTVGVFASSGDDSSTLLASEHPSRASNLSLSSTYSSSSSSSSSSIHPALSPAGLRSQGGVRSTVVPFTERKRALGGAATANRGSLAIPTSGGNVPRIGASPQDRAAAVRESKNLEPPRAISPTSSGTVKGRNSVVVSVSAPPPPQSKRDSAILQRPPASRLPGRAPVPQSATAQPLLNVRRESPASSTGDSSSGRIPLTPASSSEYGSGIRDGREQKIPLITVVDERTRGRERHKGERDAPRDHTTREVFLEDEANEQRRKERRRSEAKAAIDLGNVINGPGPVVDDDDDDRPLESAGPNRLSMMNPMMGGVGYPSPHPSVPGWNPWQQQQYLMPPGTMAPDPHFYAAHQQAMMIAKQTYQMAVAQQAIAAAGEEWERGSSVHGYSGASSASMSMYAPPQSPFGMGMPGMGGMMPGGWAGATMAYPMAPHLRGFGSAQSDIGAAGGGSVAGWAPRSVYGEPFAANMAWGRNSVIGDRNSVIGDRNSVIGGGGGGVGGGRGGGGGLSATHARRMSAQRDSGHFGSQPLQTSVPQSSGHSKNPGQGTGGVVRPRQRTSSMPAGPMNPTPQSRNTPARRPPPSSWKPRDL